MSTDNRNELLLAALSAAHRGWHVFPLIPNTKRPAIRNWEDRATVDPELIYHCWSDRPYNIGVACGPSNLVVVDLDMPKTVEGDAPEIWPMEWASRGCTTGSDVFTFVSAQAGHPAPIPTYIVATTRGGQHLYFTHPAHGPKLRNTAGALGWLIDTRAHGGYVVGAGSVLNGRTYCVEWDNNQAPLPSWLTERLQPKPLALHKSVVVELSDRRRGRYLTAAINDEVHRVASAPQGQRNRSLYLASVALGQLVAGGALTTQEVTALLEHAAYTAGLGPHETLRTIASGLRAGARRPRSVA